MLQRCINHWINSKQGHASLFEEYTRVDPLKTQFEFDLKYLTHSHLSKTYSSLEESIHTQNTIRKFLHIIIDDII